MPETKKTGTEPDRPIEPQPDAAAGAPSARKSFFSSSDLRTAAEIEPASANPAAQPLDPELPWFRINWEIKALVPIACVLLGGMLLFLLATLSWRDPERHIVLAVAGAGAVAICGALLVVLTYTVQRPMVELQQKIAQLGAGDCSG